MATILGCAHTRPGSSTAVEPPLRYSFETTASATTALQEPDGTEIVASFGEPVRRRWTGDIEQSPARRFRDGSQGDLLRFLQVEVQHGDSAPEHSELSGKALELRTFASREILAIDLLDHLLGPSQGADLMLALWPALSPRVPDLKPGEQVRQRSNLPFTLANGMGSPISLDLEWSLDPAQPCEAGSCWRLTYEGPVRGRGLDRNDLWHARYQFDGQARGELWLNELDNRIVASSLDLEFDLTTTLSDPATQQPQALLLQHQRQHASIRVVGDEP